MIYVLGTHWYIIIWISFDYTIYKFIDCANKLLIACNYSQCSITFSKFEQTVPVPNSWCARRQLMKSYKFNKKNGLKWNNKFFLFKVMFWILINRSILVFTDFLSNFYDISFPISFEMQLNQNVSIIKTAQINLVFQ